MMWQEILASKRKLNEASQNACQFCFWVSTSNLLLAAPELAKEWDYQKNDKLRPEQVTKGSKRKIWWDVLKDIHTKQM